MLEGENIKLILLFEFPPDMNHRTKRQSIGRANLLLHPIGILRLSSPTYFVRQILPFHDFSMP